MKIKAMCAQCKASFETIPSRLRNGRGKFCSRSCKYSANSFPLKSFIERITVEATGCHAWGGSRDRNGYGKIGAKLAHRVAWELASGPVPSGMFVCHHCDNPPCCNPAHLFLGTARDNAEDRDAKGRGGHAFGTAVTSTVRLDPERVTEIRRLFVNTKLNNAEIGRRFGVSGVLIGLIRRGRQWKHVPPPSPQESV